MTEPENDALGVACGCALRNVGHTHECLANRLEQVERALILLTRATSPRGAVMTADPHRSEPRRD